MVSFVSCVLSTFQLRFMAFEASLLTQHNFLKLRAALVRACWSSKLTLAHTSTVLGTLDGLGGVDPSACIVWFRFRMLRRYLAYNPRESARIGKPLELVSDRAPGHGPAHLLVRSASEQGFRWCSDGFCWSRPGLPHLPMVEGPYPHYRTAVLDAWRDWNSTDSNKAEGFSGWPASRFSRVPAAPLSLPTLGTETRDCFEGFFLGVCGMAFSLARCRGKTFRTVLVGVQMGMVICSGSVPIRPSPAPLPLMSVCESPEFHGVVNMDESGWPRCLL